VIRILNSLWQSTVEDPDAEEKQVTIVFLTDFTVGKSVPHRIDFIGNHSPVMDLPAPSPYEWKEEAGSQASHGSSRRASQASSVPAKARTWSCGVLFLSLLRRLLPALHLRVPLLLRLPKISARCPAVVDEDTLPSDQRLSLPPSLSRQPLSA
jgi:hypothetical protein